MHTQAAQDCPDTAMTLAADWLARLETAPRIADKLRLPSNNALSIATLAELSTQVLLAKKTLFIIVPDDHWLPELSNALDISLRPLCLVLPQAPFAAAITVRATLSLLKSRLSRDCEAEYAAIWEKQQQTLSERASLWKTALDWSEQGQAHSPWPNRIDELFPICILPDSQAAELDSELRDYVLLVHPERMISALPRLLMHGQHGLLLQGKQLASRDLVPLDEEARLKVAFEMLAQELGELELEFSTVQAELADFTRHYYAVVGRRIAELDAIEAQIARHAATRAPKDAEKQQQAEQAHAQAEQSRAEGERFSQADQTSDKPFAPSKDLKRLFRTLAQKIHPDRATDEQDRTWRTELMSEANRAYRNGDQMVLEEILQHWEQSQSASHRQTEHPTAQSTQSATQGLALQIAKMRQRLSEVSAELNRLLASRLYELFMAANQARRYQRDLLQEMAERLDLQIEAARTQLAQVAQ